MQRCNKARFPSNTLKKILSSGKSLISTYSISISSPLKSISEFSGAASSMSNIIMEGGGGCSGSGRLLTSSAFRMGADLRLGAYLNKYSSHRQCTKCLGHWTCNLKALSSSPTLIARWKLGSPFVSVFEADSTHRKPSSPGPTLYNYLTPLLY